MPLALDSIAARLAPFLAERTGGAVEVNGLRLLAGGASRAAIAFDLRVLDGPEAGEHPLVLRLDLGGKIFEGSLDRVAEFAVLAHARTGCVPVPRVRWASGDTAVLGRPFLIMDRVEGETVGRRIVSQAELAEARAALPAQMGRALARIHALEPAGLDFLAHPEASEGPARRALKASRAELEKIGGAHPTLEAGLAWLEAHAPSCPQPVLVHGDFRLGNMVVGPEGLRAVLDWEFTCLGDPHEDLAWPFVRDWRFGNDRLRFGGISDGADFLAAYVEAGGPPVDRARMAYWELMGNFRWALGCLTQAHRHRSGSEPSVELASLGRRSAEMELEMLDRIAAIEQGGSGARPA